MHDNPNDINLYVNLVGPAYKRRSKFSKFIRNIGRRFGWIILNL